MLLTEQDFYDLAMAYFPKAHSQGVVYAEVFFDPQTHTERGLAFAIAIKGIRRALAEAGRRWGSEGF